MSRRSRHQYLSEDEKVNRPKITKDLLIRIWNYLKPYWKQLVMVLSLIVFSSILSIIPSLLTGRIIDEGLIQQNLEILIRLIVVSFGVMLFTQLLGVLQSYLSTWIAQHITFDMRNQMFAHLQKMSHRFFTSTQQGEILTRMTSDISGVQSVITNTMASILSNTIVLIVALVAMFQKNWILALLGMVVVPLFIIPTKKVGKTRWNLTRESQESQDAINQILNETLSVSGQLLVKLYNKEEIEYQKYVQSNQRMIALNIKESMAGRWFRVAISTFASIGPMLIYLVGGYLMMKTDTTISVGDITVMVALLGRMYGPVNSLMNIQVEWIRSMALFTRLFEYYDMEVEIKNHPQAILPPSIEGNLQFDEVGFYYEKDRQILKDINFTLESGKSIAIVGPSGAGKSTIINLIPRLFDAKQGKITMDGMDIKKMDLKFLRDQIGIVSQDTYLFNASIKENLLYAKADASDQELIEACKKANIHDFIMSLSKGYDTQVGNRGLKLSGGEKQRLSIARVLLKDPVFLIFDEATSSLDSISERLIQEAIEPLIQEKTSIMIAHRLSTILAADEILVLDQGQIVERGNHHQLVDNDGLYTQLYETQFLRFNELLDEA